MIVVVFLFDSRTNNHDESGSISITFFVLLFFRRSISKKDAIGRSDFGEGKRLRLLGRIPFLSAPLLFDPELVQSVPYQKIIKPS